jgi:hypothetical protein
VCVRSERESGMGSSVVELTVLFPSFGPSFFVVSMLECEQ